MNWTKASAIAEIVSSVAVLATLAYLAIQTRQLATQTQQNTAAIISNSRNQSLDAELQLLRMVVDYPINSFSQARADGDDGRRQQAFDFALFRIRENQWLQFQDGQLDEATWEAYLNVLVGQLDGGNRLSQAWENLSRNAAQMGYDPGFVAAVRSRLMD
jgi:hypothetical protein